MTNATFYWWFELALWLAGVANFMALIAGSQVPAQFNWHEELPRLSSFNQKVFRAYYYSVMLIVVFIGLFTFCFHDAMLAGDPEALFFAGFAGCFWGTRMLIHWFYFKRSDFPEGQLITFGKSMLNFAFVGMAWTYLALIAWHVFVV